MEIVSKPNNYKTKNYVAAKLSSKLVKNSSELITHAERDKSGFVKIVRQMARLEAVVGAHEDE